MREPTTRAGQWLLDRSEWDDGNRAFRVRINATGGPDDMHRHILAIEREAVEAYAAKVRLAVEGLVERAGGRCTVVEADDPVCGTHSELLFDNECEDQPRQLLAALAALDEEGD